MLRKQARVFKGENLVADFFRGNAELGDIYQLDDRGWVIVTNIFSLLPNLKKSDFMLSPSTKKDVTYTKQTGTEVKFSGTTSTGSIESLQASIGFSGKNSAFVSLKQAVWQNIDLVKIKPYLNKLWNNNGYDKHLNKFFFVNQICIAQSGVTIFSEESSNEVKLQSKLDQVITSLSIIGEANVEIVANKKETLEIISNFEHAPLFQAVRKKNNGLWEILG